MKTPNMVCARPRSSLETKSALFSPYSLPLFVLWCRMPDTATDMGGHSSVVLPWAHFTSPDSSPGQTLKTRRAAMLPSSAMLGSAFGFGLELSPTFFSKLSSSRCDDFFSSSSDFFTCHTHYDATTEYIFW